MSFNLLKSLTSSSLQASSSGSTVYTSPVGKKTEVVSFVLFNTHTSTVTVEVFLPATSAIAATQRYAVVLEPNETLEVSGKVPFVLEGGESIFVLADVDAVCNIVAIGRDEV